MSSHRATDIPRSATATYALRYLFGYRASLIRGRPDESLRYVWDAVLAACPTWPGFRPERCSESLAPELEQETKRGMKHFDRYSQVLGNTKGHNNS